MQPLPLDEIRAKVLAVKPRKVYLCCICHHNLINGQRESGPRLCSDSACRTEAAALGWLRS